LISAVVVSEDKRYIASGSSDSFVYLYEMEKSSLVGTIENAHTSPANINILANITKGALMH